MPKDFRDTQAAVMLRSALDRAHRERGLSIRTLGKLLAYKQATVLSHMATGRVAIPLDRATAIAHVVGLPVAEFVVAALSQKAPGAADVLMPLLNQAGSSGGFAGELSAIAGQPLDDLPEEHKTVIEEVVVDRAPRRRWLTVAELRTVMAIREARPEFTDLGLPSIDVGGIVAFLSPA